MRQNIYLARGEKTMRIKTTHINVLNSKSSVSKTKKEKKHQFAEKTLILNFFLGGIRGGQKSRSVVVVPFFFIHFFFSQPYSRAPLGLRPRFARKKFFALENGLDSNFVCLRNCTLDKVQKG